MPEFQKVFQRLQWGRTQLSAEMPAALREWRVEAMLQWGRTQLSAEIRPKTRVDNTDKSQLQWGRTQLSAEMP